jgi:hypothetical protein
MAQGAVMQWMKPAGPEAGSKKYDILSALMAHALSQDKNRQKLVLRLMSLITTRYNWQRNELIMGQREIARLWCVDERTVKRDMVKLRSLGWVVTKRQGSRGRVSTLGLDIERILLDCRNTWPNIGEDYVARMSGQTEAPVDNKTNIVPFQRTYPQSNSKIWTKVRDLLKTEDPTVFRAWLDPLALTDETTEKLTVVAPSRFHASYVQTHLLTRIQVAAQRSSGSIYTIVITS